MTINQLSITINEKEIPYIDQDASMKISDNVTSQDISSILLKSKGTILFLHGILSDHRMWQYYCNHFSIEYRALAYRLSGFGLENKNIASDQFNTSIHAEELIQFCDALKLKNIIVVGWSYSNHVILLAALKRPDLFKQIILYELIVPSYGINSTDNRLFTRDLMRMMAPSIKAIRQHDLKGASDAFIQSCTNHELTLDHLSPESQQIKADNAHTLPLLLNQAPPAKISADDLQSLTIPITILWGSESRPIFKVASKIALTALEQEENNHYSQEIEGRNHYLPESDYDYFISLISRFI